MAKKLTALLILGLVTTQPVNGRSRGSWLEGWKGRHVFVFDWCCSNTSRMTPRLRAALHPHLDHERPPTKRFEADRAILVRLSTARPAVYFVPVECGATG